MNPRDLIQRSDEWYQIRAGKVTASRIADVMATTQKGWGAARKRYMDELIVERLSGKPIIRRVASMEARTELEPSARIAYEFYTDNAVTEIGFVPHPTIENAGASPDGEIDDDGFLEIKCLDASTHINLIKSGIIPPEYMLQMHFQMACGERQWCDFFAYNETLPEELKSFMRRVYRDDHAIGRIESAVKDFLAEVGAEVAQLMERDGQAELEAAFA